MDLQIQGEMAADVLERIKTILTTPQGTVCYDRAFGMDMGIVDLPLPIARVRFLAAATEQLRRYEPTVRIKNASFSYPNADNGQMQIRVVIESA